MSFVTRAFLVSRRLGITALAVAGLLACVGVDNGFSQSHGRLEIRTLSARPDLVSGGDVLVEVKAPAGTTLNQLTLTRNGQIMTRYLHLDPSTGSFRALISGLQVGDNTLRAVLEGTTKSPKGAETTLVVKNYPITGPILSGPHLSPYECRTVESGLGPPLDTDCSAAQRVEYFYRASNNTFKPLTDPTGPRPSDLVTTTTIDGKTVPYIVRVDSGTINRAIYRIAILDDPAPDGVSVSRPGDRFFRAAAPDGYTGFSRYERPQWSPGPGWNHRLAVSFGGGAGTQYNQGVNQATAALNHLYLSRGFGFMISTELVNQQHGNAVLQGEALMMLKEYFIERYGIPKWTVGVGGSGGAIQQLLITEIYPGLLDGLQPSLSFPDSTMHTPDCGLLQNFWRKADPLVWTNEKKGAVEGYTNGTCAAWERSFVPVYTATNARGCALNDPSKIYNPTTNPKGARCTVQDMRVNIYGRNPSNGFARKPQDNVGLQYGLAALNSGAISVDEFLDLNEKIGGNDVDGNFISDRSTGDPLAIRAAYESGLMNSGGGGLANVPILHSRPYNDAQGDIHDRHRDFAIRARLQKANGRSDNQVIWLGPPVARNQPRNVDLASLSLDTMTRWLDNIAADSSLVSIAKVVRNKPADAADACWDDAGKKTVEPASFSGTGACNKMYPVHSEPRLIAGAPLANDVLKCRLKPIDYSDYKASFTDSQKARIAAIFSAGVCDFSKPGLEQVPLKATFRRY